MKRVVWMVMLFSIFGLSPGCAFFRDLIGLSVQRPTVRLDSMEVKNLSLDTIDLTVGLTVTNPNSFALKLAGLDYRMDSLDQRVASGEYMAAFSVPGNGEGSLVLPIQLDVRSMRQLLLKLMAGKEKLKVIFSGHLTWDSPGGQLVIPFNDERILP